MSTPFHRRFVLTTLALAGTSLLAACASVNVTNAWRSPEFTGPGMRQVLVMGAMHSDATRRIFEDTFAQSLRSAGVGATASYSQLPDSGKVADDRLKAAVASAKADSVLVTRLLRVEQKADVITPMAPMGYYRGGFYGFYGNVWSTMPASVSTYNVLTVETSLWDARKEAVIWSATTERIQPTDVAKATAEMAEALIQKMKADGVI